MGQCCKSGSLQFVEGEFEETGKPQTFSKEIHRPKRVILIRHGESEGNIRRSLTQSVPDHMLHLTQNGREQAWKAGEQLRSVTQDQGVKFIVSPYVRTQETLNGVAMAFGGRECIDAAEDAYIREQDFGNFDREDARELHKEKKIFGKFYYRFPEGESPADVYSRAGLFLESLYRRWETHSVDNLVIVSHELFILVFLMRLFRYPVHDYYAFEGLKNGQLTVLERPDNGLSYEIAYTWAPGEDKVLGGLVRKPPDKCEQPIAQIWDGKASTPLIESDVHLYDNPARKSVRAGA